MKTKLYVSIPLEQGGVFRLIALTGLAYSGYVSIPLEQGGVFRLIKEIK